ncbi:response regulator [Ramlibacter sp. RBP-2]|uniref:Response regulator n=1 Tax=Ramlibacter lithotrophicus TaxID=2606681 RepID=A0A7X6DCS4_9BURK|nr:response regulator [Ramlibacter lithotrophicus]NKE64799.1 response regulator [Ramlibacter lithotrophicus]
MRVKKGSVLCVDDEPNILRSLHWMLHKDFDVMTAPDGHAALEMLRKHDFDVIVSDQRMPGMIGSEFLREACKLSPRAMRILLTGYSDMQAILRSINEGEVFRFVNKPWSNEELSTTVAEAAAIARTQPVPAPPPAQPAPDSIDDTLDSILVLDEDPELAGFVKQSASPRARITHASSMAEAVALLGSESVSVVVSDTRVGRMDTTPLLKVLKQRHPEIVSVVLASDSDVDAVIKLINQGQVYRFIPKPVKPAFLKIMLASAVHKHRELRRTPGMGRRHAVQAAPAGTEDRLVKAVQEEAMRLKPQAHSQGSASVLGRLGGGLKKLFGIG